MHLCPSVNRKQLTLLRKCFTKRPSIPQLLYPSAHRHKLIFVCTACLSYHELPAILHVNSLISLISQRNIFWPAHHSTGALEFQNHSAGYLYRPDRRSLARPPSTPKLLAWLVYATNIQTSNWFIYIQRWLRKTVTIITHISIKTQVNWGFWHQYTQVNKPYYKSFNFRKFT
jgi:hypothetical protein